MAGLESFLILLEVRVAFLTGLACFLSSFLALILEPDLVDFSPGADFLTTTFFGADFFSILIVLLDRSLLLL